MEASFNLVSSVSFLVAAPPLPQPRVKARVIGRREAPAGIQIYTPSNSKVAAYKKTVADGYFAQPDLPALTMDQIIELEVSFFIKRPPPMCGPSLSMSPLRHSKKPDIDNLLKTVMDALNGHAWLDDSQVYKVSAQKFYTGVELGGASGRKRVPKDPLISVTIKYFNKALDA